MSTMFFQKYSFLEAKLGMYFTLPSLWIFEWCVTTDLDCGVFSLGKEKEETLGSIQSLSLFVLMQ